MKLCRIGLHIWARWKVLEVGIMKNEAGEAVGAVLNSARECIACGRQQQRVRAITAAGAA